MADFENVRLEPVWMVDCAGKEHHFHFQMRLLGDMFVLDAFELQDGLRSGYEFRIIGTPEDEVLTLLGRLIGKIRRGFSVKHLTVDNDQPRIADQTVRGQISSDMSGPGGVPLVVVDGKEIAWDDFGRMLLAFEGWQFRLDIADRADEL